MSKNIDIEDSVVRYLETLCEVADREGIETLTKPERVVVLVWWGKALVDNGGFQFFYEGTSNAEDVATAFSEIGINTIAEAFRRSLNVFTSQSFEFDPTTRYKRSSYSVADVGAVFTELNGIVWGVDEPELLEILYGYIKANRSSFEHIQII